MAPRLALLTALTLGCGGSVVIHNNQTQTTPAASSDRAQRGNAEPARARVDYSMRVRVQGGERSTEGAASSSSASSEVVVVGEEGSDACEGLTVDEAGETLSGRRLGMGLLQVYARPGAELIVDRLHQGETPLIAVGVDAGPRDVRLRNVDLGYDCTFRLRVLPGVRYSLLLDVKADD